MSQFSNPYNPTYEQFEQPRRKTSGLAITAFILGLCGVIPCCGLVLGPIGALLGLIAVISIAGNPALKGRGLAAAAIVLGLLFTAVYVALGWRYMVAPVVHGPRDALTAGYSGDMAGFRDGFVGAGATTSDAEAQAFIDELRKRYGEFESVEVRGDTGDRPPQGEAHMRYQLKFRNKGVPAEVEMVIFDQRTGQWPARAKVLKVIDPEQGDLIYPASAASTTQPQHDASPGDSADG